MKRLIERLLYNAWVRHETHAGADYDACPDVWCRLTWWLETWLGEWVYGKGYRAS